MQYAFLGVVLAGFVIGLGQVWLKRRREALLRREIRSQPVRFWTVLTEVKVREGLGWPEWLPLRSSMALYVRDDSFDISSTILPIRVVMGMEYYFKSSETPIETSRDPSRSSTLNWIVVTGRHRGREIKVAITNRNEGRLHDAWNALVVAGATPIGPSPGNPYLMLGWHPAQEKNR
jgi:hypothetical protein